MTLATRRISLRPQRGPFMLLSSVLLALVLTIYFGAWAVSENVDARSLRAIEDSNLTPDAQATALANDETTGVESSFLFLCPFH
ncbi:MAG TPA: hypothetical protein QGI07_03350 [Dehalococcoidia bacterium]|nr:hypothetical protein [Dehalococcoidia bacterium]MDP6273032.1 hypothetical protein [Dehalococcoidia bacterium]MDP7160862.1 hypothetical protein [Dehalococcoidia bacterium]MDP7212719.1 hypothetical protein [Dehalococcoidia bacterium]MDP7514925.1 hypothetical protein [Dehalococcoidia bacterium]